MKGGGGTKLGALEKNQRKKRGGQAHKKNKGLDGKS